MDLLATSTIRETTRLIKSRSWLVMTSEPLKFTIHSSSQIIDSKSKWLVGSSISKRSGLSKRILARAMRIFQPPLKDSTGRDWASGLIPRPVRISLAREFRSYPPRCSNSSWASPYRSKILLSSSSEMGLTAESCNFFSSFATSAPNSETRPAPASTSSKADRPFISPTS